jgi:hypothetical protein
MNSALISQLGLQRDTLLGETIIITGAGGGIGFEQPERCFGWGQTWSLLRSMRLAGSKRRKNYR